MAKFVIIDPYNNARVAMNKSDVPRLIEELLDGGEYDETELEIYELGKTYIASKKYEISAQ